MTPNRPLDFATTLTSLAALGLVCATAVAAPAPRKGRAASARRTKSKPARKATKAPLPKRSITQPFREHLQPDYAPQHHDFRATPRLREWTKKLPPPVRTQKSCAPQWRSVALFFNLDMKGAKAPKGYATTTLATAKAMLDEGADPMKPGIDQFLCNYWDSLSYGKFAFGMQTPRDASGNPLVPTLTVPTKGATDWGSLIRRALDANAVAIWKASGGLMLDGKRWIPSVVLFQSYNVGASAAYGSFEHKVGGKTYVIGDRTHIRLSLDTWSPPDAPGKKGRKWWGTLLHEYGHNFLEFGDLYGPQGCTGYWDLLGDNSPPGRTSEVSSAQKARVGWLKFKKEIKGLTKPMNLTLAPYSTTGEAIKIVPDPKNTPHEYFLLEFRKSTGNEVWRPDGALKEQGLLVTHINERLGIPNTWLLRESPFFDPEFADGQDQGATDWTGHDDLEGKVYPQGTRDAFTPTTTPSSNFYGGRNSGLFVTDIKVVGNQVKFKLMVSGTQSKVDWHVSSKDRAISGRFTPNAPEQGSEILLRNGTKASVLVHRQGQWMVESLDSGSVGSWPLGAGDREHAGDFDGDGLDEIYVRSDKAAGVLEFSGIKLKSKAVKAGKIGGWALGSKDWEHIGDFDGDGRDEIYTRSPNWAGVFEFTGASIALNSIQHDKIGGWNLGGKDREFVGRFSTKTRDQLVIRSDEWIGLLSWDAASSQLKLEGIQHDKIDGWNMGSADRHQVGDFDGDGLDEIYIRSNEWAGLLEWSGGKFEVEWMTKGEIPGVPGVDAQSLAAGDRSYAGHFRIDRDAIIHRHAKGLSLLVWHAGGMKVEQRLGKSIGGWNLGSGDHFVLGDYHRLGGDVLDTGTDYVTDAITDVFVHNGWGTGMIGFNPRKVNPTSNKHKQAGLTWIQKDRLLRAP